MVLQKTLIDADIPHHDKMREAIIYYWKKLFQELKVELSVSLHFVCSVFPLLTLVYRHPVGKSVSWWMYG